MSCLTVPLLGMSPLNVRRSEWARERIEYWILCHVSGSLVQMLEDGDWRRIGFWMKSIPDQRNRAQVTSGECEAETTCVHSGWSCEDSHELLMWDLSL